MRVPNLPTELLFGILRLSIQVRDLKGILRLRLVSKLFAAEILNLLPGNPLFHAHLSSYGVKRASYSLEADHLVTILQTESGHRTSLPHLSTIKNVALELARLDPRGRGVKDFLDQLCSFAVRKYRYGSVWQEITWFAVDSRAQEYPWFAVELNIAAIHTRVAHRMPFNESPIGLPHWCERGMYSHFFGTEQEQAMTYGNLDDVMTLLTRHSQCSDFANVRRAYLRAAAEHGDIDIVRHIWNHQVDRVPWVFAEFPRDHYEGHRNNRLLAKMHTPSVTVFDFLTEKRQKHCVGKVFGAEQWTEFLVRCAQEGWTEMAAVYLKLGAGVNGIDMAQGPQHQNDHWHKGDKILQQPLLQACASGRKNMVELLLAHGAPPTKSALPVAITHGHLDIVDVLLQHRFKPTRNALILAAQRGYKLTIQKLLSHYPDDTSSMAQELLVFALDLEDEELFRYLVLLHGATVDKSCYISCFEKVRAQGLVSMQRLLEEYYNTGMNLKVIDPTITM